MTSKTPQLRAKAASVPSPTEGASLRELIQVLIDVGVRANGPLKPWTWEEFAATASITSRQLRKLRESDDCLPQTAKFKGFLLAFFGKDPTNYPEWRNALADARERVRMGRKKPTVSKDQPASSNSVADEVGSQFRSSQTAHRGRMPLHFHGRERDLETIDALMMSTPHRVALHGPHGIGKTALAAAYAFHYRHTYRAVAWIDAETDEGCVSGLVAFGQRMNWAPTSVTNAVALAATLLRLAEDGTGCLVVYDNAPSPAALHPYLPNGSPHVLITSNLPSWRSEAFPLELTGWSPAVGAGFLSKRLGIAKGSRDARDLSVLLGGFPIALEFAAAFCERRQLGVGDYRKRLSQAPGRYLLKTGLNISGYPRSIYDAFALAMTAAEEEEPAAIPVLHLFCALAPEPIPQSVISDGYKIFRSNSIEKSENDTCGDALAVLRDYALITTSAFDMGPGELELNGFAVHRLVKLVVQERLGLDESAQNSMARALANCFSTISEADANGVNLLYRLGTHVTYLLGQASANPNNAIITRLYGQYANYWIYINKYKKRPEIALYHSLRYLKRLKLAHGGHSQEASAGFVTIGLASFASGKFRSAELFIERALGIRAKCYPRWHPHVVEARLALASILWHRGDQERSKEIWKDIVSCRNLTWPEDHPEFARVLLHWAFISSFNDGREEAMLMMAEVLVIQIFTLPPDHRDIQDTRNHLSQFLRWPPNKDRDALSTIEAHARYMMELRSYNNIDVGRLWLELALLCHQSEQREVSTAYFDKALHSFPDPSPERLRALIKGWRFAPIGGDDSLVGSYHAALEQAVKLNDPIEIHRTAAGLAFVLDVSGNETEAETVRRRFLPHRPLF